MGDQQMIRNPRLLRLRDRLAQVQWFQPRQNRRLRDQDFAGQLSASNGIDDSYISTRRLHAKRSPREPGTRNMSPNEQKITPGKDARQIAWSIRDTDVTQTGQPGP